MNQCDICEEMGCDDYDPDNNYCTSDGACGDYRFVNNEYKCN